MDHDAGLILGVLTGFVAGVIMVALLFKKKVLDMTFDERQERARGKAFQYGFCTLTVCVALYGVLDTFWARWCDALVGGFLCICAAVLVVAVACIWKDAYLSLRERPKAVMVLFAVLSAVNLSFGAVLAEKFGLLENGVLTFRACNLIAGVTTTLILVAYLVKRLIDRKRGEE